MKVASRFSLLSIFALLLLLSAIGSTLPARAARPQQERSSISPSSASAPAPQSLDWSIAGVDGGFELGQADERSLALDAAGFPHIASGGDHVYYSWFDGTSWHFETVGPFADVGSVALRLDAAGQPHIVYSDFTQLAIRHAWRDGATWSIETVASGSGSRLTGSALAIDSAGQLHITYGDTAAGAVVYAHGGSTVLRQAHGDGWQFEVVEALAPDTDVDTSLALDGQGQPHLTYAVDDGLRYAYLNGTAWVTTTAVTAFLGGGDTSLALDGAGRPHVAYTTYGGIDYVSFDGTSWITETVDNDPYVLDPSLVLDAAGQPHLSYYSWSSGAVVYAFRDLGGWHSTGIDSPAWNTSLALGADGQPRVSYCHFLYNPYGFCDALKYARYDGANWILETVATFAIDVGEGASLAVDSLNKPHISYCQHRGDRSYIAYASYDGQSWQLETVAAITETDCWGAETSLALDTLDRPHIVYVDRDDRSLWYATREGSTWTIMPLGMTGVAASLALDADGLPHVVVGRHWGLVYAWYDGLSWTSQVVDAAGDGPYASLVLDGLGHAHVGYTSSQAGLEYAYCDGTSCQSEAVDPQGQVGSTVSLAVDASGRPHLSYFSSSGGLSYAFHDGGDWRIFSLDPAAADYASLALDAYGRPHIAYSVRWSGSLAYYYFDGSGWKQEPVDSSARVTKVSLSLDKLGLPHIAYHASRELYYAHLPACVPPQELGVVGPDRLPMGITALYTSIYAPPTATFPLLSWDNGSVGSTAAYSWTVTGTQTIVAAASNDCGQISATLDVGVFCQPVASLSITGPAQLPTGIGGLFSVTYAPPTASLPLSFAWSNALTGPSAAYTWTQPGTYTLAVTATNCGGLVRGDITVTVFCQPPEGVAAQGPAATLVNLPTTYDAVVVPITTSRPLTFTWDNGASGPKAVYTWPATGTYTLTMTVTNACGQVRSSRLVQVLEHWPYHAFYPICYENYNPGACVPVGGVAVAGPGLLVVGGSGHYTATYAPADATLPVTLTWDNGSVGPTATYSWADPGDYTVAVTATNPCGQAVARLSVAVVPPCQPVTAAGVTGPSVLAAGETALYTATVSPPTATLPLTLAWDNGAVGATAAYSWTVPGLYTLTVTATNACGEVSGTLLVSVTAAVCRPAQTVAITGPLALEAGATGLYTATVSPPTATLPLAIAWDNGAVGPTAAYSWTVAGLYRLTVTATNPCGLATATRMVTVTACQPVGTVAITGPLALGAGATALYTATVSPLTATLPLTLAWDNGAVGATAAYSWTVPGLYTLTVTATNTCGQVSGTLLVSVTAAVCRPVQTVVITGPLTPCTGEPIVYTATVSPPTATLPLTIAWDNGSVGSTATYSWTMPGARTLAVTVTNACGQARGTLIVAVCPTVAECPKASSRFAHPASPTLFRLA